jgi:UDP-N-acetylglucosamine diphosphorylase/glucosamine-1-phosphate N-acetyltransferase
MNLVFFEDSHCGDFYPLTLSRPACMLLSGTSEIYRKWVEAVRPEDYSFLCREYLADFVSLSTGRRVNDLSGEDNILVNGRFLPSHKTLKAVRDLKRGEALTSDDGLVACRPHAERPSKLSEVLRNLFDADAEGRALSFFSAKEIGAEGFLYLWELINANGEIITREFEDYVRRAKPNLPEMRDVEVVNQNQVRIGSGSSVAPAVVIDASDGPVIIGDNVSIEPFTLINGPVFVGHDCRIVGGRIRPGCSFGPVCRVGGEVENSMMLGYCNKYHDGFIGHAYLGEWINLGAMTANSDLKNNYSNIRVTVGDNAVDTASIKVGCFIGDHTKTGIGTMLNTGISVGFSCNLYGAGLFAQSRIGSFSWGTPDRLTDYRLEKAIETAAASMGRRNMEMTAIHERLFAHIHGLEAGT